MQQRDDIQLTEHIDFQRREWKTQRFAWAVMVLVVIATAAGLFGVGPLSEATAGDDRTPVLADYERFVRYQSQTDLEVRLSGEALSGETASVWLSTAYLDVMSLREVTPQPQSVQVADDRMTFTFEASPDATEVSVSFALVPDRIGGVAGEIGAGEGPGLSLDQFVYP